MKNLGLYIHIPFCESKCSYCDFISFCGQEKRMNEYVEAMIGEMRLYKGKFTGKVFDTLYIGGGTPSVLPVGAVNKIISAVKENFNFNKTSEITIEANPRSLSEEKLTEYLRAGVNRISLGVQCLNDEVLKTIGRAQTVADINNAFEILNKHNVKNISADLMLGLPNETKEDINATINFFTKHGVKHISAYGLQLEEGTPLQKQVKSGKLSVPNEDEVTNQYNYACMRMRELGFVRYEISNFAKVEEGRQKAKFVISKHNSKYWDGSEYLGLGVSASGYFNGVRYTNTTNLDEYINNIKQKKLPIAYKEKLTKIQKREEKIMLSLRTTRGLNLEEFKAEFNEDLLKTKKQEIERLIKANFIEIKNNILTIKEDKFYVANLIILELI